MRLREIAGFLGLRPAGPSLPTSSPDAASHDQRQPQHAFVRFVDGHAEFRDEFAVRTAATGRPVVRRDVPMPARSNWRPISRDSQLIGKRAAEARACGARSASVRSRSSSAMRHAAARSAGCVPRHESSSNRQINHQFTKSPIHQIADSSPLRSRPRWRRSRPPRWRPDRSGRPFSSTPSPCGLPSARRSAGRLRSRPCGCPDRPAASVAIGVIGAGLRVRRKWLR